MCGIAGVFARGGSGFPLDSIAREMSLSLSHRGPDAQGVWCDNAAGIGFAHSRLAIVDRSEAGQQPMASANGRYRVTFNGEIYNHLELRKAMGKQGLSVNWKGHSDTETLVECVAHWGLASTLSQVVGMFAFALWDKHKHSLVIARDRFGEKPLYYGWSDSTFVFSSELKAFEKVPNFEKNLSREALASFIRFSYIPDPGTIFEEVHKLPPGTWMEVAASGSNARITPNVYWSAAQAVEKSRKELLVLSSDGEATAELEEVLTRAVRLQMMGDVPIGAFLSGGVDSTLIAALMQENSVNPINTFSIGFDDTRFNEAPHAKNVSSFLGTDHHELYISEEDVKDFVPRLPTIYDEPFADISQIPTFFVSHLAKQTVTVSLSGDGGDELFGGYAHYFLVPTIWNVVRWFPLPLRMQLSDLLTTVSPASWQKLSDRLSRTISRSGGSRMVGQRVHRLAGLLQSTDAKNLYQLFQTASGSEMLMRDSSNWIVREEPTWKISGELVDQMMLEDTEESLLSGILTKVDRASMANSLESRMPFLDHRVFEFAWGLPASHKIRAKTGKWILRELLHQKVDKSLVDRPKMGFGMPLGDWLKGSLREWAEELLNRKRIESDGYLNAGAVHKIWNEHLDGTRDRKDVIWNVLMFQSWLDAQGRSVNPRGHE